MKKRSASFNDIDELEDASLFDRVYNKSEETADRVSQRLREIQSQISSLEATEKLIEGKSKAQRKFRAFITGDEVRISFPLPTLKPAAVRCRTSESAIT